MQTTHSLVTYGYGFGDDHIIRVIKDMLTIPSTHLLVISWDDKTGRIARFAEDRRRLGQVSLMVGARMAGLLALIDKWLPWPSAEFLLQRRAQIYRDRSPGTASPPPKGPGSGGLVGRVPVHTLGQPLSLSVGRWATSPDGASRLTWTTSARVPRSSSPTKPGATLGIGTLSGGTTTRAAHGNDFPPCQFDLAVKDVESGHAFYGVTVGTHTKQFSADDLKDLTMTYKGSQ